jgi:hypothetical protein
MARNMLLCKSSRPKEMSEDPKANPPIVRGAGTTTPTMISVLFQTQAFWAAPASPEGPHPTTALDLVG